MLDPQLALERRDHLMPHDDKEASEAWQSLFAGSASHKKPRSLRAFVLSKPPVGVASAVVIASLRSNLSFVFLSAKEKRDCFVPRNDKLMRAKRD